MVLSYLVLLTKNCGRFIKKLVVHFPPKPMQRKVAQLENWGFWRVLTEMNESTTFDCTSDAHDGIVCLQPFELFYLSELLAEGIISKELFDLTYQQLASNLNSDKKGLEMEK